MRFYQLGINPGEYEAEGEDHDEWFTSLSAARSRRAELIRSKPREEYQYGEDFEIHEVELRDLPPRALLLAVLNQRGYVATRRLVVEAYHPPLDQQPDEDE